MGLVTPSSTGNDTEQKPLTPRVDSLDGKHIGLYDNGKPAAEPLLTAVQEMLAERYPDATFEWYHVEHLNQIKNDEEQAAVTEWAEDVDVAIGAIGDCGSCTKFLTWGIEFIEDAGTPGVGLIDEGFELDYQSNAVERGRPLRYKKTPVRCETTDLERVREEVTDEVLDGIVDELTRPLNDKERADPVAQ
ncbi:hypothetical protein J2752_001709 [Halarchaeum rubridurum]|uniref:UGSC-like domain-containing protein n=1 Tax=Halarchaeum rubridurum TaxID=489911 RepID=A0A830FQ47_9EURY|nr:hypothetical protein [Halarchaeum rubridurum]MBP1954797.1 hypothetical protein [Halarchaeum rubridurum]GGM59817.1 hypothetical protein GCM10009017_07470 [Halarchaeum rubridurum]